MTANPYAMLIRCKPWAGRGLHESVAANLGRLDAQDAAIVPLILDHIQVVDRIFQHPLQGRPRPFRAPRSEVTPGLDALAQDAREVDAW